MTIGLHTYGVPGCSILEYYTHPTGAWRAPRAHFYNHSMYTQSLLWKSVWKTEREHAAFATHSAALVLRLDLVLWEPLALARRITELSRRGAEDDYMGHPVRFTMLLPEPKNLRITSAYFCTAFAAAESEKPFISDVLQYVPQRHFDTLAATFPGHDAGECLRSRGVTIRFLQAEPTSPSPQNCKNSLYHFAGRPASIEVCNSSRYPPTEQFVRGCAYLGVPAWKQRSLRLRDAARDTAELQLSSSVAALKAELLTSTARDCGHITGT